MAGFIFPKKKKFIFVITIIKLYKNNKKHTLTP